MIKINTGIYQIKNILNGKVYIGSSVNIKSRWSQHVSVLNKNKHHSSYLQHSWNKYGKSNFEFSILELVEDSDVLLEREQYYLDHFQCYIADYGYNNSRKAGTCLGVKHTDESRKKNSDSKKGQIISEETKRKIGESHKLRWKTISEVEKENWRLKLLGKRGIRSKKNTRRNIVNKKRIPSSSENNKSYKLNDTQVKDIKLYLKFSELKLYEIAKIYEMSPVAIGRIERGKSWIHISIEESILPLNLKKISDEIVENRKVKNTLLKEEVVQIKNMLYEKTVSLEYIADKFNISKQSIIDIKNNKTWKNICV